MAKKESIRLGLIGLGARGDGLLRLVFTKHEDARIVAVSDVYEDRIKRAQEIIKKDNKIDADGYTDYRKLLSREDIDAVIICTSWNNHINVAIDAMRAGKAVAVEVAGAYSIEELWELIHVYEETKTPVTMLENCVFGRDELMVRNMADKGVLGHIVHCEGGYRHDLRSELSGGRKNRHYRLDNYIHRNAENYPTHELGPIAKILKINRGNRLLSLVSVSSKAMGLREYINERKDQFPELSGVDFVQGDVVNTIIKCAGGETVSLTLDTTLPRFYSRGFYIQGTKGMYCEDNRSIFLDEHKHAKDHFAWNKHWNNVEEFRKKYEHPIWKKYIKEGVKEGHDGMDWLVFRDFVDVVKGVKKEFEVDIYDMVTWMSITALSEDSIACGGAPVPIPDFTKGLWINRK